MAATAVKVLVTEPMRNRWLKGVGFAGGAVGESVGFAVNGFAIADDEDDAGEVVFKLMAEGGGVDGRCGSESGDGPCGENNEGTAHRRLFSGLEQCGYDGVAEFGEVGVDAVAGGGGGWRRRRPGRGCP